MQRFRHGSLFPLTRTARTGRPSALSDALLLLAVPSVGCGGGETPETAALAPSTKL